MRIVLWFLVVSIGFTSACKKQESPFTVDGRVIDVFHNGIPGILIKYGDRQVITDASGDFRLENLNQAVEVIAHDNAYTFTPSVITVDKQTPDIAFRANYRLDSISSKIANWLQSQQLPNGLIESAENGNVVSLYDQALAALVFISTGDLAAAEKIFDFFAARISTELQQGPGGFAQLRDRNGTPNYHRWMGDNAWLLIALHHFRIVTDDHSYDALSTALSYWLQSLQDTDGGLWAGYAADNTRLNYKVTEGMIDAFVAVPSYTDFHRDLLGYLKADRWDSVDRNLMAWPTNPPYKWALDNFSWAYCTFPDYPVASLDAANRFKTTQTASVTGNTLEGYDIDEDRETIFMEGTGQMALAFHVAGRETERLYVLNEMQKAFISSATYFNAGGFPYASNAGSGYGSDPLWPTAHLEIALSGGAWYVLAQTGFNPLRLGFKKTVPVGDQFWQ